MILSGAIRTEDKVARLIDDATVCEREREIRYLNERNKLEGPHDLHNDLALKSRSSIARADFAKIFAARKGQTCIVRGPRIENERLRRNKTDNRRTEVGK